MSKTSNKRADQYDVDYNYLEYWDGRDYEHAAEEMAIKRLLKGKKFRSAADIGGGYGRLCILLQHYATKVTLAEPSNVQLEIAEKFLKEYPGIGRKQMQADELKFKDGELDLVTMIRVMHHLPQPMKELNELHRVLSEDGRLILEVANYAHGRNRVRHFLKGQKMPIDPVDIRSEENRKADLIPFVNHNPKTVIKQLDEAGFKVEKVLSVSNLRSQKLKRVVPHAVMISAERIMQRGLARTYFGPSVWFLVKKKS